MGKNLCKSIINAKYEDTKDSWTTKSIKGSHGMVVWKMGKQQLEKAAEDLTYKLGNGRRIKFWWDTWCDDRPLVEKYVSHNS